MKTKEQIIETSRAMKQYFIMLNYTQSNLSAMERDLLDQANPFDKCLI